DVPPSDVPCADVERAAVPAERAPRIEADVHQSRAVVAGTAPNAAGDVAPDFVGVLDAEGYAVTTEPRTHTPGVSEQRVAGQQVAGTPRLHRARRPLLRRGAGGRDTQYHTQAFQFLEHGDFFSVGRLASPRRGSL